jgi:hypothetical protein
MEDKSDGPEGLTVDQLRELLKDVPGHLPVIQFSDSEGNQIRQSAGVRVVKAIIYDNDWDVDVVAEEDIGTEWNPADVVDALALEPIN